MLIKQTNYQGKSKCKNDGLIKKNPIRGHYENFITFNRVFK